MSYHFLTASTLEAIGEAEALMALGALAESKDQQAYVGGTTWKRIGVRCRAVGAVVRRMA